MNQQKCKYPVYQPLLSGNEKKYVTDCLDSSWISSKGSYLEKFESEFARFIEIPYSTSVCNGTIALHLALIALGIGPGDEVIVPTLTYVASVNTIVQVGATPIFVDSCKTHWQMDPLDVREKITDKTRAIIAVHLYGHPCDMEELVNISKTYALFLIEDCAEAIGTYYRGKHVGTFGDISTFSFYGNKTITTGEGGMVVCSNKGLYERCFHYKTQGLVQHRQYWHDVVGYNYRMTNICAAIGLAQLEMVDIILKEKMRVAQTYIRELEGLTLEFQKETGEVKHSYWMFSILVPNSNQRDELRDHLKTQGIETRPLFYPVHQMPMYNHRFSSHPIAESIGSRGINLPSFPALSDIEIKEICQSIRSYFDNVNGN